MGVICRQNGVCSGLCCGRGGGDVGDLSPVVLRWHEYVTYCWGYDENDEEISSDASLLSGDSIETCLDGRGVHQLLPWQHL